MTFICPNPISEQDWFFFDILCSGPELLAEIIFT